MDCFRRHHSLEKLQSLVNNSCISEKRETGSSATDPLPHLWQKFLFSGHLAMRRANIHVRIYGNPDQKYVLLFPDYLYAHPDMVATLELIKIRISKLTQNIESYLSIKDPVYDLLIIAAKEWEKANSKQVGQAS